MDENDETCVNIWVEIEETNGSDPIWEIESTRIYSDSLKDSKKREQEEYESDPGKYTKVAMEMYASLYDTLIDDDYLDYTDTPKRQCYGIIYEEGNGWKDWKIFSDKLREKKKELYDLYDEFEPENKKQRERFKEKVMSHSSDGEHFIENNSLKIETWYFLTITEATEHLLFDKYLEFCPFIKDDKCSASDIEGLKKHFSLPDELILNGIKRKINQHKDLESRRKFAMVKKFLVKNDYLQWGSSVSDMLPRLKEEMKSRDISDDMLKDCLDSYRKEFRVVTDVPDRLSADCRKCFEHIILQKINMSYDIWCEDIKKEWEIKENDGLVYYTAFNNFPWKHEKLECFEHILLQRNDDSYKCSCEGVKQIFYSLTKEEKNLLLKFEEHIKYSPDYDNCSAEAIESLRRCFFLPEDLIVNGIKRKINQFKMAENQRKFSDVVNFLLAKNYLKSSILVLLRQLKEESMFSDLDDDILKEALGVYFGMLQSLAPNVSSADFRKHYKRMLKQRIDVYLGNGHHMMKMLWEIKNKDYFYYGTLKFADRTAMKLGNMERKKICKQSRWGKDDSRLSKRRNTFGDCLDERDVDEILLEVFVIEKEIIRINSTILSSYMKRWVLP